MSAADKLHKQGNIEYLLKLISFKFRPLPEGTLHRVQCTSMTQLDRFFERVLVARARSRVHRSRWQYALSTSTRHLTNRKQTDTPDWLAYSIARRDQLILSQPSNPCPLLPRR